MTGTPTANWGFPTYDGTEPGSLKTIANAQANAAETAMNNASKGFYLPYTTLVALKAAPTTGLQVGQHATVYNDNSNNGEYTWDGTQWNRGGLPLIGAFTPASGGIYSKGTPIPQAVRQNGRVWLEGIISGTSGSYAAGNTYTLGSIPSTFAPSATRSFPMAANTVVVGQLNVDSSGNLKFTAGIAFTNTFTGLLDGLSWRDA